MKKIVFIVLSLVFILAVSMNVFAAELTMGLAAEKTTANRGDSIVVTVSVGEFEACTGGSLRISYDSSVFERSENKWLLTGTAMQIPDGDAAFAYGSSSPTTISGAVYQFTLTVKENAAFSASSVSVKLDLKNAAGTTSVTQSVSVTVVCTHAYDNSCDTSCNICGESREITHTWNGGEITTQPTCSAEGVRTYTCTVCGQTKTEAAEKLSHSWDSGEVTKAATCTDSGTRLYHCTGCSATKEETISKTGHSYTNDCDTSCNTCGATRTITHSYKSSWSSNASGHWHACSVCGEKKDEAAHTPGEAATEWEDQTCTVCGYVIQAALGHTHKYDEAWTTDETGHWRACSGCEDTMDRAEHTYSGDCDADCDICGYQREITHTYDEDWKYDGMTHYHACTLCGEKKDEQAHTIQDGSCSVCGADVAALEHTHTYGDNWQHDGSGHWQECEICGEGAEAQVHTWDEGTVTREPTQTVAGNKVYKCTVCGAESVETIPSLSASPDKEDSFPWWILIVAAGLLVVGCSVFLIVGISIGKKQTGKYSVK